MRFQKPPYHIATWRRPSYTKTTMSQLLGDVLGNRNYGEPPEIKQIKEFVETQIGIVPAVSVNSETFVVRVPSAAAAGALRGKIFQLQRQIEGKRRIVIRIG